MTMSIFIFFYLIIFILFPRNWFYWVNNWLLLLIATFISCCILDNSHNLFQKYLFLYLYKYLLGLLDLPLLLLPIGFATCLFFLSGTKSEGVLVKSIAPDDADVPQKCLLINSARTISSFRFSLSYLPRPRKFPVVNLYKDYFNSLSIATISWLMISYVLHRYKPVLENGFPRSLLYCCNVIGIFVPGMYSTFFWSA